MFILHRYVRDIFHLAPPHESALRNWVSKIDCSPGFTAQSFKQLHKKVEEEKGKGQKVVVQLVLDEMSIKRQIKFDGSKFSGRLFRQHDFEF